MTTGHSSHHNHTSSHHTSNDPGRDGGATLPVDLSTVYDFARQPSASITLNVSNHWWCLSK